VQHFATLLGDNPDVVFSIVDGPRAGTRLVVLDQVKISEAKRPAAAKDDTAP
jgi:hypothetical protein